jgi:small subunit ribosomal protein S16
MKDWKQSYVRWERTSGALKDKFKEVTLAVVIRLKRVGTTKKHHHRVVVADSRFSRDGRIIESLGHYNPNKDPGEVKVDRDRALYWLKQGAKPSDTVRSLLTGQGIKLPQ